MAGGWAYSGSLSQARPSSASQARGGAGPAKSSERRGSSSQQKQRGAKVEGGKDKGKKRAEVVELLDSSDEGDVAISSDDLVDPKDVRFPPSYPHL